MRNWGLYFVNFQAVVSFLFFRGSRQRRFLRSGPHMFWMMSFRRCFCSMAVDLQSSVSAKRFQIRYHCFSSSSVRHLNGPRLCRPCLKFTLRAKGTLISEPRFSTPCEMRFFPRKKGKTALFKESYSMKRPFSPFSRGKNRISQGVENQGSPISVPLALRVVLGLWQIWFLRCFQFCRFSVHGNGLRVAEPRSFRKNTCLRFSTCAQNWEELDTFKRCFRGFPSWGCKFQGRKGSFCCMKKGFGEPENWSKIAPPSVPPPEALYDTWASQILNHMCSVAKNGLLAALLGLFGPLASTPLSRTFLGPHSHPALAGPLRNTHHTQTTSQSEPSKEPPPKQNALPILLLSSFLSFVLRPFLHLFLLFVTLSCFHFRKPSGCWVNIITSRNDITKKVSMQ